jgi:cell division protein FtsI (penicillin-binding protein 3)
VFSELVQHSLRIMGVQPDISVRPQVVSSTEDESF